MIEKFIDDSWNSYMSSCNFARATQKLKHIQHALVDWQKNNGRNSRKKIKLIQEQLARVKKEMTSWKPNTIRQLEKDLAKEIKREEVYWAQEARQNWLQLGDRNTSFFHAKTIQRRKRNTLIGSSRCTGTMEELLYINATYSRGVF